MSPTEFGILHAVEWIKLEWKDTCEERFRSMIERAGFQSQRCGIAVAYASLLSGWLRGRSVEEAGRIGPAELMRHFGSRAGATDAAGRAISGLRQALSQIPKTELVGHQGM